MRYRKALIPTAKEAPSDATTVSHSLLIRAGYIRRVGAGIYTFLPLGVRVLERIKQIVVEEMDRIGCQQVLMPAMLPADYFRESGRWDVFGHELIRFQDRKGGDYHLGPTHEEIVTDLARRTIQSHRDLPQTLYQVQTKFRDEPRPRAGLLRCREFLMKDAYSFDADFEQAQVSYAAQRDAYTRIFDRTGLTYRRVAADAGSMGGSRSEEFQVLVHSGEDILVACTQCEYAANLEVAQSAQQAPAGSAGAESEPMQRQSVAGLGAPADLAVHLGLQPGQVLSTHAVALDGQVAVAVLRADHELNLGKLARLAGAREAQLLEEGAARKLLGGPPAYWGPVGFDGKVYVDVAANSLPEAAAGGGRGEILTHAVVGRDYQAEAVGDLRSVVDGDPCPQCGGELKRFRGIEAGHIFLLGRHYTEKMGATYLDRDQKKQHLVMGCYGIGISRLVAAAIEQHHDSLGIAWPMSISPYHIHLTQLGSGEQVDAAVAQIEKQLEEAGLEVLVDDRDERPGVKFKDADLIGIPLRITVGDRGLKNGIVELKRRAEKGSEEVPLADIAERARAAAVELLSAQGGK